MADFQGIIVIHKEKGFTSHDVVAKLRGILHMKKIGHTGTLDPDATGVLPVALGKGTKLVDLLTDKEKTYEAVLHLGIDTDTQDMSGTVLEEKPVNVTEEEVRKVLKSFVGVKQPRFCPVLRCRYFPANAQNLHNRYYSRELHRYENGSY